MHANDALTQYSFSENYHGYMLGMVLTDGAKALADTYKCYWFLDVIASYQPQLTDEEFQVWRLSKLEDGSAIVTCEDGNGKRLVMQHVDHTDFRATTATVWVEDIVILLPSEH